MAAASVTRDELFVQVAVLDDVDCDFENYFADFFESYLAKF